MVTQTADVLIVGAGPGGAATALSLAPTGARTLLIDRARFPRDKICGDAISGKSVDVLRKLNLLDRLKAMESIGSFGVTFSGPYGAEVHIPFGKEVTEPPGYLSPRLAFDNMLVEAVREHPAIELWEGAQLRELLIEGGRVRGARIQRGKETITVQTPLIIGADGAYSAVVRLLGMNQLHEAHYCAGLRVYYKGVTGFHPGNFVEIHFVDEAIPGYFWIFPLPDNRANVGIGMLSSEIKKRGVKLKDLLEAMIAHPRFRHRFTHAQRLGPVKGWGLPLGSRMRPLAGEGWMLVGDAGSLIDPFTGEGIGNALFSGMLAGQWAAEALQADTFSKQFLKQYEKAVYERLRNELRLSRGMQLLGRWKWLLNTVIDRAARSEELADLISCMFDDLNQRRKLLNPLFYLRILTAS